MQHTFSRVNILFFDSKILYYHVLNNDFENYGHLLKEKIADYYDAT